MSTINITDFSGPLTPESNVEPTWGEASDTSLPAQSSVANTSTPSAGNITGRNPQLNNIFSSAAIGLTGYDPRALYVSMMDGSNSELALGSDPAAGSGQYFGASVTNSHLGYENAPNLSAVDTEALNIPNPFTPDVSAGKTTPDSYAADFHAKYPGTRNSFPPDGAKPGTPLSGGTTLDLAAGADGFETGDFSGTTLSPSATSGRTGGWFTDTTLNWGRWTAE